MPENNISLMQKIINRRRSSDPYCWTCTTYPNCDLCHRRTALRRPPARTLTDEQKKACRKIIRQTSLYKQEITPAECRIKAATAAQLAQTGILLLVKKAEYECRYTYRVNIEHPAINKAWKKHADREAKKLQKILRKKK